jgi:hypothetical protein
VPKGKRVRRYLPRLKPALLPNPAYHSQRSPFAFARGRPYEDEPLGQVTFAGIARVHDNRSAARREPRGDTSRHR